MANALYTKGKEKMLKGQISFSADTIKVALVKTSYAQNLATNQYVSDLTTNRIGTDQTLTTKSVTGGVFNAADVTWTGISAGYSAEAVVIYKYGTSSGDSPLIAYIDTITGFPLATNGGDITVQWDNGAYKIFSL